MFRVIIDEDEYARAASGPGVTISDGEIRRIHQIVAEKVAPVPVLEVLPFAGPAARGTDSSSSLCLAAPGRRMPCW